MRRATEDTLLGGGEDSKALGGQWIKVGTCGWEGDQTRADALELGDGSDGPGGMDLLRVTLYEGRGLDQRPKKGRAQGRPIRVRLGWPLRAIPPIGMQVVVLFPDGDMATSGNGVILQGIAPAATQQWSASRILLDGGADMDVTVKGRTVLLADHGGDAPGGHGAYLAVGPVGGGATVIYATDGADGVLSIGSGAAGLAIGDGSGHTTAVVNLGSSGFGVLVNNSGFLSLDTSGAWNMSGQTAAFGVGSLSLGANATPATPVVLGVSGMTGVGSTSIYGQP